MKAETRVGIFIVVAVAIFLYLSFNIGAFRLDGSSFFEYKIYFNDTGGLEKKSTVKIAGVNVGWVDTITLMDNGLAEISIKVNAKQKLFRNAYATISQSSIVGSRTLEIDPGDSSSGILPPGHALSVPGRSAATVNDILENFNEISHTVQDVVSVFKATFATPDAEKRMHSMMQSLENITNKMSNFSNDLEFVARNSKQDIVSAINNIEQASQEAKDLLPELRHDINRVGNDASDTLHQFGKSAQHMTDTFKSCSMVADRINRGHGTLGKLVAEEALYDDVKETVSGVKELVGKASKFSVNIDINNVQLYRTDNSRGSICFQLAAYDDYFYNFEMTFDEAGRLSRKRTYTQFYDRQGNEIDLLDNTTSVYERADAAFRKDVIVQDPDAILFGAQFAKKFDNLTLRIGLFDSNAGIGCDYQLPLRFKQFKWITSLDLFDFVGRNRLNDKRPHARWTNKIFVISNMYTIFGMDDFLSKHNSSPFFGGGISFDDDDFKFILSYLPISAMA